MPYTVAMHVYFCGIGGTGIGPLALIAKQAGYLVSGSDKQDSDYIAYLKKNGITAIATEQTTDSIAAVHAQHPIDWLVYSSAVEKENPLGHPEIQFARDNNIVCTKRDTFLSELLEKSGKKLIAIAGTHGKTTTTAMAIWVFKHLDLPISYSVGAKLSFGDMGEYSSESTYFVYEADEYDRNFLSYSPYMGIISGIDYDHPDIYPTRGSYYEAFRQFIEQSTHTTSFRDDLQKIHNIENKDTIYIPNESLLDSLYLTGKVNRLDALLVATALHYTLDKPLDELITILNAFPGVSRRFEKIAENLYSDYAHTPEKVRGALQMAHEVAGDDVVVVYEGLHNTRQHFIKEELKTLFEGIKKLYIAPSYLAREDESLELLTPEKLCAITQKPHEREPVELNDTLKETIASHVKSGDLVLCLTAGGGGSLDEWLRKEFTQR